MEGLVAGENLENALVIRLIDEDGPVEVVLQNRRKVVPQSRVQVPDLLNEMVELVLVANRPSEMPGMAGPVLGSHGILLPP